MPLRGNSLKHAPLRSLGGRLSNMLFSKGHGFCFSWSFKLVIFKVSTPLFSVNFLLFTWSRCCCAASWGFLFVKDKWIQIESFRIPERVKSFHLDLTHRSPEYLYSTWSLCLSKDLSWGNTIIYPMSNASALRIPQMFNHSDGSSEGLGLTLKQVPKRRKKVNN